MTTKHDWDVIFFQILCDYPTDNYFSRVQERANQIWQLLSCVQETANRTWILLSCVQETANRTWILLSCVQERANRHWNLLAPLEQGQIGAETCLLAPR